MTDRVQILAIAGSLAFLALVLELVRRRKLAEEYSALWILSAIVLMGISWKRSLIDVTARWLGVYYPPAVLLLLLIGIISMASLSISVILSRQQRQIDRVIEENAILSAELRMLRRPSPTPDFLSVGTKHPVGDPTHSDSPPGSSLP